MTRILSISGIAVLIATAWLSGCTTPVEKTAAPADKSASLTVLRVGLTPNYPPLVDKVGGKLEGIEIDLAGEVAKDLDKRVEFVELPWDQLIPALTRGDIDVIMSGMSITKAREQTIAFTEPYMHIGQMAITRIDEIQKLGSLTALLNAPITVGFERDTTGEVFVETNMRNARPEPLDSIEAGVAALRNKSIDAFVHDAPTAWRIGSDPAYQDLIGLYWPLTDEYLAWGVRKSDKALREALSNEIKRMQKDGRLARISRKWIKVRVEVK